MEDQHVQESLDQEQMEEFRHEYLMMHPYNQGQFFQKQQKDNRLLIYYYLSPGEIADIMEHIDVEDTKIYFKEMDPQFASAVFTDMPADDAVDILNELDKDMVASFLTIMDKTAAEEVKALLHYEEKTAGSIMTTEYIAFMKHDTVQEVMHTLKLNAPDAETIYYLYVLHEDQDRKSTRLNSSHVAISYAVFCLK